MRQVRTRTIITMIVAVLLGVVASVATYDLIANSRHAPVSHDDQDPGLIP